MAIDYEAIAHDYYGGNAEIFCLPAPVPEYKDTYIPLDKLPQSVRDLSSHNPDKAKQLLADAGYPNGFTFSVACYSAYVDMLSILKENFAKIGVNMELDIKDTTVYNSM